MRREGADGRPQLDARGDCADEAGGPQNGHHECSGGMVIIEAQCRLLNTSSSSSGSTIIEPLSIIFNIYQLLGVVFHVYFIYRKSGGVFAIKGTTLWSRFGYYIDAMCDLPK